MPTKKQQLEAATAIIRNLHGARTTPEVAAQKNQAWTTVKSVASAFRVDISTAEKIFKLNPRYAVQEVTIPANQRGNLAAYAGKKVLLFTATIDRYSARINGYICEA